MKLTDQFVATVQPAAKVAFYRDDEQSGFHLRVSSMGKKVWALEVKIRGRQYSRTIGPATVYKAREARLLAKKIIGELIQGVDSIADLKTEEKARRQEALKRKSLETIGEASLAYVTTVKLKPATVAFYEKLTNLYLKDFANTPLRDVDGDWVREAFEKVSKGTSALQATKTVRYVKTLCLWRELPNPIPVRLRLATPKARQARLEPEDGRRLWVSLQGLLKHHYGAFTATLLLTGCRTSELSSLRVQDVDLVAGYFKLYDTKNGRDHKVYIADVTASVLSPFLKGRKPSDLVFAGSGEGRATQRILQGTKTWSNHDLRKLFAIVAMEVAIPYPVIKAALNHSSGDVTLAHYAQATPAQLRACWERIAAYFIEPVCNTFNEPHCAPTHIPVRSHDEGKVLH